MTIAFSASGRRAATWRLLNPPQEMPIIPTRPLHQGWAAIHRIASSPSASSCSRYWSTMIPSDSPEPRMSTRTHA